MNMAQTLENKDFTTTFLVDQTPSEVFHAITNVRGWWSEDIEGATFQLNDEFSYHYKDIHSCKMRVIKVVPVLPLLQLASAILSPPDPLFPAQISA
jgi:hypothetical protein